MDQRLFITRLNVEHFKSKLAGELSHDMRQMVSTLLAEEEKRLASLEAKIAEEGLLELLGELAQRAGDVLDDSGDGNIQLRRAGGLIAIMDSAPVALSLVNPAGEQILLNGQMRRWAPERIPSREPGSRAHWTIFDERGRVVGPDRWPGARALKGIAVKPGVRAMHMDEDGHETELRVAAVPVTCSRGEVKGAVAAVYEPPALRTATLHQFLSAYRTGTVH